jgi:hypothetical protein
MGCLWGTGSVEKRGTRTTEKEDGRRHTQWFSEGVELGSRANPKTR